MELILPLGLLFQLWDQVPSSSFVGLVTLIAYALLCFLGIKTYLTHSYRSTPLRCQLLSPFERVPGWPGSTEGTTEPLSSQHPGCIVIAYEGEVQKVLAEELKHSPLASVAPLELLSLNDLNPTSLLNEALILVILVDNASDPTHGKPNPPKSRPLEVARGGD